MPSRDDFSDLLAGNEAYARTHAPIDWTGVARRGLAVLTCIDSRIDPLAILGLVPGDAKILRNAGARATEDAVRSLAVSAAVLGVERIAVIQHTGCKMTQVSQAEAAAAVTEASGGDAAGFDFGVTDDQLATLAADVEALRAHPLIASSVTVAGFVLDLDTGRLGAH